MGKKRNIVMDQSQEEILNQRSENKYSDSKPRNAFDLPEEFAMLEAEKNKRESKQSNPDAETEKTKSSSKKKVKKVRSAKYKNLKHKLPKKTKYSIQDGINKLLEISKEKFDASIEVHIVSKKENLSGKIDLPHGTGKEKKIVIFDDKVLAAIEAKKVDFDLLIARPEDMPKLAKHAKLLGPKGLMPNPKNGTVNKDPEKALKQLSGNKLSYKTEKKAPLIHLTIGKRSFGAKVLVENLEAVFRAINPKQLKKVDICSSMSPNLTLDIDKITA